MPYGLSENTISKLHGLFEEFPAIEKVILYGSRAMGNYRNGSDIDLTLVGDIPWNLVSRLNWEIDDLLLPYMIDLSRLKDINNPNLIDHIDRRGEVFYEREKVPQ
ncbi:MAG: nucleotidyltransferase domain-containing protein [Pricia sp.]